MLSEEHLYPWLSRSSCSASERSARRTTASSSPTARTRRSGKAIETIGKYHPKDEPSFIEVDSERTQYWLGVGAQPTDSVQRILEITGDWQKFKGLPGAEGTLKVKEPKPSKLELFEAALEAAGEEPMSEATTPKKKGAAKKAESKDAEAGAERGCQGTRVPRTRRELPR